MGTRRWILWQGLITPSMERFIVGASNVGFALSGLILQAHEETPYVVRYAIEVDAAWRTRKVEVELEDGGERRLSLTVDGDGNWSGEGQRLGQVVGCIDVDLEWSPSTNTLPIRRLGLADRRYRYRSGRFTADLAVDEDGIVLQYGVNWKAVASSGELA